MSGVTYSYAKSKQLIGALLANDQRDLFRTDGGMPKNVDETLHQLYVQMFNLMLKDPLNPQLQTILETISRMEAAKQGSVNFAKARFVTLVPFLRTERPEWNSAKYALARTMDPAYVEILFKYLDLYFAFTGQMARMQLNKRTLDQRQLKEDEMRRAFESQQSRNELPYVVPLPPAFTYQPLINRRAPVEVVRPHIRAEHDQQVRDELLKQKVGLNMRNYNNQPSSSSSSQSPRTAPPGPAISTKSFKQPSPVAAPVRAPPRPPPTTAAVTPKNPNLDSVIEEYNQDIKRAHLRHEIQEAGLLERRLRQGGEGSLDTEEHNKALAVEAKQFARELAAALRKKNNSIYGKAGGKTKKKKTRKDPLSFDDDDEDGDDDDDYDDE